MTRTCPQCGESYDTGDVRRKYCSGVCQRAAGREITARANRMHALRHCAAAFTVATGMLDTNPNICAAQAAWEYSTIYSHPHPCGASTRN